MDNTPSHLLRTGNRQIYPRLAIYQRNCKHRAPEHNCTESSNDRAHEIDQNQMKRRLETNGSHKLPPQSPVMPNASSSSFLLKATKTLRTLWGKGGRGRDVKTEKHARFDVRHLIYIPERTRATKLLETYFLLYLEKNREALLSPYNQYRRSRVSRSAGQRSTSHSEVGKTAQRGSFSQSAARPRQSTPPT